MRAIRSEVTAWFAENGREFPWRRADSPYHVFVAEILLRQTQAHRVVSAYQHLVDRYPSPELLAGADVEELRRFFAPLGLVGRANLMIKAAQVIVDEHDGLLPDNMESLRRLPGMGRYSSSAVLCLSFGARIPMIDEGAGRLVRRVLGLKSNGPAYSDRRLLQVAHRLLPTARKAVRNFNLGLLDLASSYCRPANPKCRLCPLSRECDEAAKRSVQ